MPPPGANKKKKRKAAKKKKKKQLSNKNNRGEDDPRSEEIGDEDEVDNEEGGSSNVGVALESQSGNDGGENEEEDEDEEEAEMSDAVVGDSGYVKGLGNEGSLDHEEDIFVEPKESLEELANPMEEDEGVIYEPAERVVSASEATNQVVEDVPDEAIEVLNGNELSKDKMVSSHVEDIKAIESPDVGDEKTVVPSNRNEVAENESVPSRIVEDTFTKTSESSDAITLKEDEDNKVSSSHNPTVEAEGTKEDDYTESSQTQANVPCAAPIVQRTTWKCCCGLFEVFAGSSR